MTLQTSSDQLHVERQRANIILFSMFLAAVVAVFFTAVILGVRFGVWQYYGLAADAVLLGGGMGAALVVARRGKFRQAAAFAIGSLGVAAVVLVILFSGLGTLISLSIVFMGLLFAIQLLEGANITRGVVGILIGSFATAAADLLFPWYQLDASAVQTLYAFVVAGIIIAFTAFLLTQFRNYSIPAKLLAAFLVAALLPVGVLTYLYDRSSQEALSQQANAALLGTAQQTAAEFDRFITSNLDAVRTEAQITYFADYLAIPAYQRETADEHVNTARINELLVKLQRRDHLNIDSYALLDSRGVDVADTYRADIGIRKNDREYFIKPLENGLPYVSPAEYSKTAGIYAIYFSAPVRDASGNIVGVLRMRYKASTLQELMRQDNGLGGAESFGILLDEYNIRLAHGKNPSRIFKAVGALDEQTLAELKTAGRLPQDLSAEQVSTDLPEFEAGLRNAAAEPVFSAAIGSVVGEKAVVAVYNMETQPWRVAYAQPESVIYASIKQQAQTASIIALVIAALVSALGLFVTRLFSRPIDGLTRAAQLIAAGEANVQAVVETRDEIGALAVSFNDMTAQLTRRASELSTVAEVGTATSTLLETDQLLQSVVDLTKERFGLYHAHIYLLDEAGENLVLASGAGEAGKTMVAEGRSIPLDREQSLVARAARERKGVTVNDVTLAPDFLPNPLLPNTRSEMAVPLIVGNQTLGVFDVQSDVAGRFTDLDINIQTTLASQVAVSLQNARQVQQTVVAAAELAGFQTAVGEAAIVATTDVQGRILEVNDNFTRISKYSREELIGQDHRILNSGYHSKEFIRDLWVTIANGKVWRNEIRNRAKDGSYYWVDSTIAPLLNERGKPYKYVAIRFDVTQRKELELETAKRARELGMLDAITQKIQSATHIEDALQITARELGQALGMKPTRVMLDQSALLGEDREKKENA